MFDYAVANPTIDFDRTIDTQTDSPKAFERLAFAITTARNRVTAAILEQLVPNTILETRDDLGCVVEYDGPTVMVAGIEASEGSPGRLGLEVRDGDLIFVSSNGVWLGTSHYDEMPAEVETYNFVTSGTKSDYNALVEEKLEIDLQKHRDVINFLMAA